MKVKCIEEDQDFNEYLKINKFYSVVAINLYRNSDLDKKKVEFICVDKNCFQPRCSYKLDSSYNFNFYPISSENFEILSDTIPNGWKIDIDERVISVEPKILEKYWEGLYNDGSYALEIFRKESLKIIAFDSGKDMRGLFAEDLLTHIAEKGYNPEELSKWAKEYRLDFLEEMYEQEVLPEIKAMVEDLSLYDWNPDLAIPEEELMEKLKKWSEEGIVEQLSALSFEDILKTYKIDK